MQTAGLRPADGQGKPCPYGTRDILPVRKRRFMARSQAPSRARIPGGSASQAAWHNFAACPGRAGDRRSQAGAWERDGKGHP